MTHKEKYTGIVKWFNTNKKGFGYILFDITNIEDSAPQFVKDIAEKKTKTKVYDKIAEIYFHITGIAETEKSLLPETPVSFQFKKGEQGAMAINIGIVK
jgi:cold shock CspA family protein